MEMTQAGDFLLSLLTAGHAFPPAAASCTPVIFPPAGVLSRRRGSGRQREAIQQGPARAV
jgi:hypothetical protein